MTTRQAAAGIVACGAAMAAYSAAVYSRLPERLPSHWNIRGEVDGWMPRAAGSAMMPGMSILFLVLLVGLPYLSPSQFKIEPFRGTFNYLMLLCAGLMAFIHVVMQQAALDAGWDSGRAIVAGIFLFFGLLGNLMGKTRRNFFVGIRTPWTLASDSVWVATHRMAGQLMVGGGIVGAIAVLAGAPQVACFALLMFVVLAPVPYSLVLYKREEAARPE